MHLIRASYSPEFKISTIQEYFCRKTNAEEFCKSKNVPTQTFYRWLLYAFCVLIIMLETTTVYRYNIGMNLNTLLISKNISQYRLAKNSDVPQSTISDICLKKTSLDKCSVITLYNIASSLDVSIEDLLFKEVDLISPQSFDVFKSSICHMVKTHKPEDFLKAIHASNIVSELFNNEEYAKCFYLIAMVDYVSNKYSIQSDDFYKAYRKYSLLDPLYPSSVIIYDKIMNTNQKKIEIRKTALKEFKVFNIMERDVENVY